MNKILVVEDDESIAKMIEVTLDMGNYSCDKVYDGIAAKEKIENNKYSLILLDVMLPGIDGFSLMKYIKPLKIPTIFITAKQDVVDRVHGLKLGAEDYILKSFEAMELLARVEVVLRRYHNEEDVIEYHDIKADITKHQVTCNDEIINLTPKEFDILVFFLKHKDIVIRKERLMAEIWGYDFVGETRTVDTHVQQVRKKMKLKEKLVTIPKVGYCLYS